MISIRSFVALDRGSKFTHVFKSHVKDGRYLELVVGPFRHLSLSILRSCVAFFSWESSCPQSNLQMKRQPEARAGNEPAYFGVSFLSLDFFGLGDIGQSWFWLVFRDSRRI